MLEHWEGLLQVGYVRHSRARVSGPAESLRVASQG
jgi:hypothetical protein